jgi:hypothetical protein
MSWRQLFARRPQWWIDLAARVRRMFGSGAEDDPTATRYGRSGERAHFWAEFRAGQLEADQRALEDRQFLTPCPEDVSSK